MPPETPLNKAHQYASNAEEYLGQGLLVSAAEEHYKSAEAFLQCVDQASDEGTKRTLRMLYNEHNKAGKELQRKIAKLTEEGKDPNLPQPSMMPLRERDSNHQLLGNTSASDLSPRTRLGASSYPIDESYMVLGQQSETQDTFTRFWRNLEGMLDNLSQPVAFATAPLARLPSEDLLNENNLPREDTDVTGKVKQLSLHEDSPSATVATPADPDDLEEITADEGSSTDEAFFIVPSAGSTSSSTKLQKENVSLKLQLADLQKKYEIAERMRIEQDEQLRERIEIARREAQRVKSSGFLPPRQTHPSDLNALNIPAHSTFPHLLGSRDQVFQLTRRVKELEEEIRATRLENERQKAMIAKFRERWERLKESAKRKRQAKANAGTNNIIEERIEEEAGSDVAIKEKGLGSTES